MNGGDREYPRDLFVSYASEDVALVEPLAERLGRDGYKVWFAPHDMAVTKDLASNLWNALRQCRQVLICLSNSYCTKEYTQLELKLNFSMDPINRDNRAIPVLVRPLSQPVPPEVLCVPWADLTRPERYEAEYRRLKSSVLPPSSAPDLRTIASPAEVQALQRLGDPDKVLMQMLRYAREIFTYIHRAEIAGPAPGQTADLVEDLLQSQKLPGEVLALIKILKLYVGMMDGVPVELWALRPALEALFRLSEWTCAKYRPPLADPFVAFWSETAKDAPPPDFPYQLTGGRRRLTGVGAFFPGQGTQDGVPVDLLVVPIEPAYEKLFLSEARWCTAEDSPLPVKSYRVSKTGMGDIWGMLALERPEGCALTTLHERFHPIPPRLATALARRTAHAFAAMTQHAEGLAASLFHPANTVVDHSGAIRLLWNWDRQDAEESPEESAPALRREGFWFSRPSDSAAGAPKEWGDVCAALGPALEGCGADAESVARLKSAGSAARLIELLSGLPGDAAADRADLGDTVESVLEKRDLPVRIASPPKEKPLPPVLPKPSFSLRARLEMACRRAWPLEPGKVLVQDLAGALSELDLESGNERPIGGRSLRVRRAAVAAEGRLALGGWDGEVRWFAAGGREGEGALRGAIGDLQWLGGECLAGSWNGRLVRFGTAGECDLAAVPGGVRKIAVSSGDAFAVLGMNGGVSVYRGGERTGQSPPIPDAEDLAWAGERLVLLTGRGIVTVHATAAMSKPVRPPVRGALRLLSDPEAGACLLLEPDGNSWVVDRAGTFPRGPKLPRGDRSLAVSRGFSRSIAGSSGGLAFWRGPQLVKTWIEAVDAALSFDGRILVVVLPDAVEVYEDAG